jgi:transposase-like protein
MRCRKCRSDLLTKNGFIRRHQRYRCRSCGFNFTQEHSKGWPPSSKLLIVVSHCCGETISDLAEQSGATTASVFRWIEEARESIYGDRKMVQWVIEALTEAVNFALMIEERPKTETEIYVEFMNQIEWLESLFARMRTADNRPPTDAQDSAFITRHVEEIADKLRKIGKQSSLPRQA